MMNSAALRRHIEVSLPDVVSKLNGYLRGECVEEIKELLRRIGSGGKLPHWFDLLASGQSMPNLDGKTIGSVVEMTLVGVLERHTLAAFNVPPLTVNPAKGVDIPFLDLGVKSPSENYCTSEPFFSAYERVLGNEYDALVLLTDYQTAKKNPPPVRVQIIKAKYLKGSQIADRNLCAIAKKNRQLLLDQSETLCKKFLQFLCHVNQADWRAKSLVRLLSALFEGDLVINDLVTTLEKDFRKKQSSALRKGLVPASEDELVRLLDIRSSNQKVSAIINACNDWVVDNHKDFARFPNDNEWQRFLRSPLDGRIGMSFALQWRYDFCNVFSDVDLLPLAEVLNLDAHAAPVQEREGIID